MSLTWEPRKDDEVAIRGAHRSSRSEFKILHESCGDIKTLTATWQQSDGIDVGDAGVPI
jgi:hypothetical protein